METQSRAARPAAHGAPAAPDDPPAAGELTTPPAVLRVAAPAAAAAPAATGTVGVAGEPADVVIQSATQAPPQAPVPRHRTWLWAGLEIVTSVAAAIVLPLWSRNINVDPLDRVGQVSGLAAIGLRFSIAAGLVIAALLLAHRLAGPRWRAPATRLGCAAMAGLATGLIAGGIVVALRGTPWSLWVGDGDYKELLQWVRMIGEGQSIPARYPPLIMYIVGGWAWLSGLPLAYALKDVQIVGTALFGPAAYLCWRLVLPPGWALSIGVVAMLPFVEPVKPYPQITLVMLVPVLIAFYRRIRRAGELTVRRAVAAGVVFGAGLGLLFLLYSGWFVWIAPGAALALALVLPWRAAIRRALLLAGTAAVAFTAIAWIHLRGLFNQAGAVGDNYFYFDVYADPAYIAMWRNDRPADVGRVWPPLGELGGVGLFTVLLVVGLAVAIWLGWRRTAVIVLVSSLAGAWLVRMWLASEMYQTQLVRLYPRTTMVILYCLLLLTGFAVMYAVETVRDRLGHRVVTGIGGRAVPVGLMLLPLAFFFATAGSATANRYLPNEDPAHTGFFSWIAHKHRLYGGSCSDYGELHGLCR